MADTDPAALVLVVDDDPQHRRIVARWLDVAGHRVESCASGAEALAALERVLPDVILLDLHMEGVDGLEVLAAVRSSQPDVPVVMLTADVAVPTVVRAMSAGAFDFVAKPVDRARVLTTVRNATARRRLEARVRTLERAAGGGTSLLGESPPVRALLEQLERVAQSQVTVLIHGESGSGKELVAREIHSRSSRAGGPFVAVNCAAIPPTLQESELFGHEKGAFTGASERRAGRFEQAHGGTLFLDEVAETSAALQAALLRAVQERRFHRVGGTDEVRVDVRIVAATHVDLRRAVDEGRFREDLYFRLAVFELEVPPLRDRGSDVLVLARRFLAERCAAEGRPPLRLSPEVERTLLAWPWPGNVRELQNAMDRAVIDARGDLVTLANLPPRMVHPSAEEPRRAPPARGAPPERPPSSPPPASRARLADLEREAIEASLARHDGNVLAACRELGVPRTTMYRRLERYGLRGKGGDPVE